jgi:hypothetical protein
MSNLTRSRTSRAMTEALPGGPHAFGNAKSPQRWTCWPMRAARIGPKRGADISPRHQRGARGPGQRYRASGVERDPSEALEKAADQLSEAMHRDAGIQELPKSLAARKR